ncbi:MAG: imidazole glycerol phosphate synthase subunit HisF [Campylobacteraceae bacterium]|nr:imidazole glycerol phosphate synthase subunit HisF [Campylobacteraceae bacterium]
MLKKRVIAVIMIKDGLVVQSIGFKKYLPIGKIDIAIEFLEHWDVDEIAIIDIEATANNKVINHNSIKKASKKCFLPICAGGGINSISDARRILASGADKIILSSVVFEKNDFILECAETFGTQSIIVCLDVKKIGGEYRCFTNSGTINTNISPIDFIKENQEKGIGEILINSIDMDGTKKGYDIELINSVQEVSNIPVIALGGAGNFEHMNSVIKQTDVSAVAAGNIFHFIEHSTAIAKAYLKNSNVSIRKSNLLDYSNHLFNEYTRVIPFQFSEAL